MYILTLEAGDNSMNFVYAQDMKAMLKALPYAIRKGVVLYGDPAQDNITQTRMLKQDCRETADDKTCLKVLQERLIGGHVSCHPDGTRFLGMLSKDHYYMAPESAQLHPFKDAIKETKAKARGWN